MPRHAVAMRVAVITWIQKTMAVVDGHRMICPTIIGAVHPPETEKEAVVVMIDEVEEGTRGVEAEIITEVGVDRAAADRGVDQGLMRGITIDVVGAEVAVGIVG